MGLGVYASHLVRAVLRVSPTCILVYLHRMQYMHVVYTFFSSHECEMSYSCISREACSYGIVAIPAAISFRASDLCFWTRVHKSSWLLYLLFLKVSFRRLISSVQAIIIAYGAGPLNDSGQYSLCLWRTVLRTRGKQIGLEGWYFWVQQIPSSRPVFCGHLREKVPCLFHFHRELEIRVDNTKTLKEILKLFVSVRPNCRICTTAGVYGLQFKRFHVQVGWNRKVGYPMATPSLWPWNKSL
jgi:hypothetical protein